MSGRAHLFVVPDPEPDDTSGPGPRPVPVPALAYVPAPASPALPDQPDTPDHPDVPDAPDEPAQPDAPDVPDGAEGLDDDADEGEGDDVEAGEEPRRRMPDLRPYCDPRPLAELGPLAVEVSKTAGPPLLRGLGRLIVFCARGLFALAVTVVLWLTGRIGAKGGVGARLVGAGVAGYFAVKLSERHAAVGWVLGVAVVLIASMFSSGRLEVPESKPAKATAKGKGSAKTAPAKGKKNAPAKGKKNAPADDDETPDEDAEEVAKEDVPAPRGGLFARFLRRPADDPEDDPEDGPEDDPEDEDEEPPADDPDEGDDETPADHPDGTPAGGPEKAPAEDPLTALIRAEIGTDNGVHLAVLRPAMRAALPGLSEATDQELRATLVAAGWDPSRTFRSRGVAGRAGVHRDQLPPLPSPGTPAPPSPLPSPRPSPGPRPANSSPLSAHSPPPGEWTEEEVKRGFRVVPDPERGPAGSRIERHPQ